MRGNEFLDKMELIDPAYIEAADAVPKEKRTVWTGWRAAMAACLCVVLLAGTAMAVSGGGTWLVELFTRESDLHGKESGYELGAEIRKFPVSELSEKMQAVSGEFRWRSWREEFSLPGEAEAFIGLAPLKVLDWEIGEPLDTTVLALGSSSGKIEQITVISGYNVDDIVLQTNTEIYTEYWDGEDGTMKVVMPGRTGFTENLYTNANGNLCQIISFFDQESGRFWMSGHLVDNGIFYTVFLNYTEPDAARAEELLHQWADMF